MLHRKEPLTCNFDVGRAGLICNPCGNVAEALNLTCKFPSFRLMLTAMPVKIVLKV
jgi:hypothetical protein